MEIAILHDDIDDSHYSRYFFVTDPVGRLLGVSKRDLDVSHSSASKVVTVTSLTKKQQDSLGVNPKNIANINDCPYVMVFVDDVIALAMTTIWLR